MEEILYRHFPGIISDFEFSQDRFSLGQSRKGGWDMPIKTYNLATLIMELTEYQEAGAILLPEEEIERWLTASPYSSPVNEIRACVHL
jgi:hypothetical protein